VAVSGRTWKGFVAVAVVVLAVAAAPALAASLNGTPVIEGDAVVGSQLTAEASWTSDTTTVRYAWQLCPDGGGDDDDDDGDDDDDDDDAGCQAIAGATGPIYTPSPQDAGDRIRVWVEVSESGDSPDAEYSDPTPVVKPAPPPPPPVPPGASASRPSPSGAAPNAAQTAAPASAATRALRYLRPFPIVRIKGRLTDGGAIVTLLRVTAPRRSRVRVACAGASCPLPKLRQAAGRVHALERFLAAGTRIVIRVRRGDMVGKHVRITIRDGKVPARRDACVLPGSARAAPCPQP
jgi:hypothetical protein